MAHFFVVTRVVGLRQILHRTHRQAEVGGVAHQLNGGIEKRHQPHAVWAEKKRNKLIAHYSDQNAQSLHTTEKAGVFQDM